MKKEIQQIIDFIDNPIYSEDSESKNYLSDGQTLDIIYNKLKNLINK